MPDRPAPTNRLATITAHAETAHEIATALVLRARMLHTAQLVRELVPTADAVEVMSAGHEPPAADVLSLHRVSADDGTPLWTDGDLLDGALASFRTEEGATWADTVDLVEQNLIDALAGRRVGEVWPEVPAAPWVHRVTLPSRAEVKAATQGPEPVVAAARAHQLNDQARLVPVDGDDPTAIAVWTLAGVCVAFYLDHDIGVIAIDVHEDDPDPEVLIPGTTRAALQVTLDGRVLYDAHEEHAATTRPPAAT